MTDEIPPRSRLTRRELLRFGSLAAAGTFLGRLQPAMAGPFVDADFLKLVPAATPSTDASGLLPAISQSGGDLVITFNCLPVADRGDAELRVQHSSDLGNPDPWLATVDQVPDADDPTADNGVTFVVDTISAAPLNKVTATINSSEASGGRLFGRLMGTELP